MPNIKSAKKRVQLTKIQNLRNKAAKTALKTKIKKFDVALQNGAEAAQPSYLEAVSGVDKAVSKGVMHKNAAARKKSQLARKMNQAAAK